MDFISCADKDGFRKSSHILSLQDLQLSGLGTVFSYYNNSWHPIREQQVECYKNSTFTLGERTNSRLESINGKVESVCARYVYLIAYSSFVYIVMWQFCANCQFSMQLQLSTIASQLHDKVWRKKFGKFGICM